MIREETLSFSSVTVTSIKKLIPQFGVEEPDWLAQSADLNPIQPLWDELDYRL